MPFPTSRFPRRLVLLALAATAATGLLAPAQAMGPEGRWMYEVTVTNITYNQRFTPLLLATHKPDLQLFKLGEPSSPQLAVLAEEGNVAPLRAAPDSALEDYRNSAIRMLCIAGLSRTPQLSLPLLKRNGAPMGLSLLGPRGSDLGLIALTQRLAAAGLGA